MLTLIAGPCLAESYQTCRDVAGCISSICHNLSINYIFKASWTKANRTSATSPSSAANQTSTLLWLNEIRQRGTEVLTDIHETTQAPVVARSVNWLMIPALLARQTPLIEAAAAQGVGVAIKRGPTQHPISLHHTLFKAREAKKTILIERGQPYGPDNIVSDFRYVIPYSRFTNTLVAFDATHTAQTPPINSTSSTGNRALTPILARAAVAAGFNAIFMEVHPNPPTALSDAAIQYPLKEIGPLLTQLASIHKAVG